ncbi:unnamed protein product [Ranitomeya imitator]|uniref:Uncharacterized protein n=1 Tax=Ranitomeya imitator TaxID=111125 RepID=A0ABN9MF88_9NEOB|nr:unnamed protein product [Ranitomeya imitator]
MKPFGNARLTLLCRIISLVKGPRYGAPVELSWPERRSRSDLALPTAFLEVVDFVPYEESLKTIST